MNSVNIIGRMTKDPVVNYNPDTQLAVARFTLAINRPKKNGKDQGADFPSCVAFGKTAEVIEKWAHQGDRIGVTGRINTGSYTHKNGYKVYTTDVIVDKIDFLENKQKVDERAPQSPTEANEQMDMSANFQELDEDIPY